MTRALPLIGILALFAAFMPSLRAQSYPSGPLRIVVPYAPGGGTDILGRAIAQKLNERHGQPAKLQQEVARILNLPELKQRLADDGMTVVASTPDEFAAFMKRETAKYHRVIETAGIKGTL